MLCCAYKKEQGLSEKISTDGVLVVVCLFWLYDFAGKAGDELGVRQIAEHNYI